MPSQPSERPEFARRVSEISPLDAHCLRKNKSISTVAEQSLKFPAPQNTHPGIPGDFSQAHINGFLLKGLTHTASSLKAGAYLQHHCMPSHFPAQASSRPYAHDCLDNTAHYCTRVIDTHRTLGRAHRGIPRPQNTQSRYSRTNHHKSYCRPDLQSLHHIHGASHLGVPCPARNCGTLCRMADLPQIRKKNTLPISIFTCSKCKFLYHRRSAFGLWRFRPSLVHAFIGYVMKYLRILIFALVICIPATAFANPLPSPSPSYCSHAR